MLLRSDPTRDWSQLAGLFEGPRQSLAPMDAYRLGDVVTVQFELPGVDPASIDLQIERGELRLQARRSASAPSGAQYLVRERSDAVIQRRLMLGDVLDVDHVDAEYADGMLTLRVPLSESAKPRQVSVRRGGDADGKAQPIEVEST